MAVEYVDNSLVGSLGSPDLGHAGTEADPYSADDFWGYWDGSEWVGGVLKSADGSDSYKLRNFGQSLSFVDIETANPFPASGAILIENWYANESWGYRINGNSDVLNAKIVRGVFQVYSSNHMEGIQGRSSIFIIEGENITEFTSSNMNFYGCTIISNRLLGQSNSGTIAYKDCVIDVNEILGDPLSRDYDNCVFTLSDPGLSNANNCQFNWSAPSWPAWNATKDNWDSATLSAGITTPPQPGAGSPDYTDYDTGPWGGPRTGIGAFSFTVPVMNSFSQGTAAPGETVTSTVDGATLVSKIQDAGTDTYFDSTSEVRSVAVTYTHQDGRQKKTILHERAAGFQGFVSWPEGARDGTWEKTLVESYDFNGAKNSLRRTDIGTGEDLTMSDGTMSLNT